ncbi:MAG: hypothetical protein FWC00_03670 [Firmicutes bacterium]|nr:hypothetical protein [Bacillota bacterium]
MRGLFYIVLLLSTLGSSAVVLFVPEFLPAAQEYHNGFSLVRNFFVDIVNGDYSFGTSVWHFYQYAMVFFLLLNMGMLILMFMFFLLSSFNLYNVRRFYGIAWTFFTACAVLTGIWIWNHIHHYGSNFSDFNLSDNWVALIPAGLALLNVAIAIVFGILDFRGRRPRDH